MPKKARIDIQALRGLAILLVVLHHTKIPFLSAGYLGVDVFFVISGFLITGLIKSSIERGNFRLSDFYFRRAKRLDMDDRTETLIRSLKRSGSDYSEVFIKGPETEAIGRLVLDDYSATLFSSSPKTFAAIDAEIARGHQLADAIERIAFSRTD